MWPSRTIPVAFRQLSESFYWLYCTSLSLVQEVDLKNLTGYKQSIMSLSDGGKLYRGELEIVLCREPIVWLFLLSCCISSFSLPAPPRSPETTPTSSCLPTYTRCMCQTPPNHSPTRPLPKLQLQNEWLCTLSTQQLFFHKSLFSATWPLNPNHDLSETSSFSPSHLAPMSFTISDLIPVPAVNAVPDLQLLTKSPNPLFHRKDLLTCWQALNLDLSIPSLFQLCIRSNI